MGSALKVLHSTGKDDWCTPPEVLAYVRSRWGSPAIDMAAMRGTAVCPCYVGPDHHKEGWRDGLTWSPFAAALEREHRLVWCNPPYSRTGGGLEAWTLVMYEASLAGFRVAATFFARTETRAWHLYVSQAAEVHFIKGRLSFIDPDTGERRHPAPAPSVICYWDVAAGWGGPRYSNLDLRPWR